MKNVIRFSLVVILLNTGFMMEASEDLEIKVLDSQNLFVELNSGSKGDVLLLKDKFGRVLFKDSITTNSSYQKTFNMELVPLGLYYLNLDNELGIQTTVIAKTNYGLEIGKESDFVFKPFFKIEDKKVRVQLTNSEQKIISLNVYDSSGILVGDLKSKDYILKKTLDFSNVPFGKYKIEIEINGQKFTEVVNLE